MGCPKCNGNNIMCIEYMYDSQERYDGISEIRCNDCKKRFGRWTLEEIPTGYCESRWGERGLVKSN